MSTCTHVTANVPAALTSLLAATFATLARMGGYNRRWQAGTPIVHYRHSAKTADIPYDLCRLALTVAAQVLNDNLNCDAPGGKRVHSQCPAASTRVNA